MEGCTIGGLILELPWDPGYGFGFKPACFGDRHYCVQNMQLCGKFDTTQLTPRAALSTFLINDRIRSLILPRKLLLFLQFFFERGLLQTF